MIHDASFTSPVFGIPPGSTARTEILESWVDADRRRWSSNLEHSKLDDSKIMNEGTYMNIMMSVLLLPYLRNPAGYSSPF